MSKSHSSIIIGLLVLPACGVRSMLELGVERDSGAIDGGSSSGGFSQVTLIPGTGGESPHLLAATAVSAGTDTSCLLREDGTVWCWGANNNGQLGNGTTEPSSVPVQVIGINSAVTIAAGGSWRQGAASAGNSTYNCAVLGDGTVQCWGSRGWGGSYNLEDPHAVDAPHQSSVPILIPGIKDAVAVAGGDWHACALLRSGSIACWGDNRDGQLGDGTTMGSWDSVAVLGISSATALVGQGSNFSCALLEEGSVECWGEPLMLLGNGGEYAEGSTPTVVPFTQATPMSLAAGYDDACAALSDGNVQCWTRYSVDPPATVPGLRSTQAISVGNGHSCALIEDGTVQCWGLNHSGQLGNSSIASDADHLSSFPPRTVVGISDAVAVSAGYFYSCALLKTGSVWCWGKNSSGQLGNGTTGEELPYSSVPVEVQGF